MYAKFPCPHCGKNLKVGEEYFGQKARCPHCKGTVTVPNPEPTPPAETNVDWTAIVDRPTAKEAKPAAKRTPTSVSRFLGGTDVNPLWSSLIALVATIAVILALLPFQQYYLAAVIVDRGWVPFVETFLFIWAITFLVIKYRKVRAQRDSMLFDLLPTEIAEDITADNADQFLAHIRQSAGETTNSILVNRVQRGLEHFKVRRSSSEVATVLASQSDIDANAIISSYTLVKVCNWAIPILGFIGTVIGIGGAVAGLGGDTAGNMDAIKQQLGSITTGLGIAFDTTLVALVMSLFITFPASSFQKSEEDLLNQVDDYCNENLLLRLREPTTEEPPAASDASRLSDLQRAMVATAEEQMKKIVDQLSQHLSTLATRTEAVEKNVASLLHQSTDASLKQLAAVEKGLVSLSRVLEKLGGERVVIEVAPPLAKAKRGWFGFSRSNGAS